MVMLLLSLPVYGELLSFVVGGLVGRTSAPQSWHLETMPIVCVAAAQTQFVCSECGGVLRQQLQARTRWEPRTE